MDKKEKPKASNAILTISTSLLSLVIAASFFRREWLPAVFLLCNVLAAILCILLFDRDEDVGCLMVISCNTLLFVGWYCGLSYHQMTEPLETTKERIIGGVGFFATLSALAAIAFFVFFK